MELTEEQKAIKKAKQAVAHRKWRQSPKYAAYKQRQKEKRALVNQPAPEVK